MNSEQPTPATAYARQRLSLRPHLVTVVVGLLVGGHCVLSNLVHGQGWGAIALDEETMLGRGITPAPLPGPVLQITNVYGWPWRWVAFSIEATGPTFDPKFCFWQGPALAANIGLSASLVLVAVAIAELAARRFGLTFKFSVRTGLLGTAAIAIILAWYVHTSRRIARENDVAEEVFTSGGDCFVSCHGPRWLKLFWLERHFAYLVAVRFDETADVNALTEALSSIQALECVQFQVRGGFDSRPLTRLQQIEDLQLDLDCWPEGLNESLAAMPNLKRLTLYTPVQVLTHFEDWEALPEVPRLTQLVADVDRPAPPESCRLEHLEAFRAEGSMLDESWAKWLTLQPRLRVIDLMDLSDDSWEIDALAGCQNLKKLVVRWRSGEKSALYETPPQAPAGVQLCNAEDFEYLELDLAPGFAVLGARRKRWEHWWDHTDSRRDRFGVWAPR